jgi:hypothetical protein
MVILGHRTGPSLLGIDVGIDGLIVADRKAQILSWGKASSLSTNEQSKKWTLDLRDQALGLVQGSAVGQREYAVRIIHEDAAAVAGINLPSVDDQRTRSRR